MAENPLANTERVHSTSLSWGVGKVTLSAGQRAFLCGPHLPPPSLPPPSDAGAQVVARPAPHAPRREAGGACPRESAPAAGTSTSTSTSTSTGASTSTEPCTAPTPRNRCGCGQGRARGQGCAGGRARGGGRRPRDCGPSSSSGRAHWCWCWLGRGAAGAARARAASDVRQRDERGRVFRCGRRALSRNDQTPAVRLVIFGSTALHGRQLLLLPGEP